MMPGLSVFRNLPMPAKLGIVAILGGGVLTAMFLLIPLPVLLVVFIGLILVAALLLLYRRLLKWLNERKAAPMENGVIQNTAATPQGVGAAANLARLDDLRKQFEEGIAKFRAAGKSLYNFPWYMIVGEPGSGKTEAIRHCNVGFPPGLQDQFQGAGGTLNMNWWFTDHAVMLDTAGRLMFDEVDSGGSSEWKEFLKLLKKYRPQCPMNGVFLVIPADSLIKDTSDEIEQKASKIARQFDMIQRTLDVRFPVFVVITKSDLINGFRDFFDDLEDPQLQHQILGWSNPSQLDEPYNPDFINQHLKSIQERLFRRRLALLGEIVAESGNPGIEQKRSPHTLYAFPKSLAKIAPRMARYLELIFSVGSQWSCKPLFFRGIYFTSSMREGSALDEDLAESLGMSVDALPEGRVWERDRAYFLRDLFLKKVFREKGLVTDATNAKKQHMRRKAAVLLCAAASVILLLFGTIYGAISFRRSIGEMKDFFEIPSHLIAESDEQAANQLQVIKEDEEKGKYRYIGGGEFEGMPKDVTRSNFSAHLARLVNGWEKEGAPWIFAPATRLAEGIQSERFTNAQAVVYEIGVLRPFVDAAAQRMRDQQGGQWSQKNTDIHVLRQLLRLKAKKNLSKETGYEDQLFLDPLFEYVFPLADVAKEDNEGFAKLTANYEKDKANLHEPIDFIYTGTSSPTLVSSDPSLFEAAIERGIERFNAYWTDANQVGEGSEDSPDFFAHVEALKKLKGTFDQFEAAEKDILTLESRFSSESDTLYLEDGWSRFIRDWDKSFKAMEIATEDINKHMVTLSNPASLEELWQSVSEEANKSANDHYQFLLTELESYDVNDGSFLGRIRGQLESARDNIRNNLTDSIFKDRLDVIDANFYAQKEGGRLYELRFGMYELCNKHFMTNERLKNADAYSFELVGGQIQNAVDDTEKTNLRIMSEEKDVSFKKVGEVCRFAMKVNQQRHLYLILDKSLEAPPKTVEEIGNFVGKQGKWDWTRVPGEIEDHKYDPELAEKLLGSWQALRIALEDFPAEQDLKKKFEDANDAYGEYPNRYFDYWLDTVPKSMIRSRIEIDATQLESLTLERVFNEFLDGLGILLEEAVMPLRAYASPDDDKKIGQFSDYLVKTRDKRNNDRIYGVVLDRWKDFSKGKDVSTRRQSLLSLSRAEYLRKYAPFKYNTPAEFVEMYWAKLSFELLWGVDMARSYKRWAKGIEDVWPGLPRAGDTYYCIVTLLAQDEQIELAKQSKGKSLLDADRLTWFQVVQGDKVGGSKTRSLENSIGKFEYPGRPLKIEFYRLVSDVDANDVAHTIPEFPGPWAVLRMLQEYYYDAEETAGRIRLKVPDGEDSNQVLFLQLEFFEKVEGEDPKNLKGENPLEFPRLDKWPPLE